MLQVDDRRDETFAQRIATRLIFKRFQRRQSNDE